MGKLIGITGLIGSGKSTVARVVAAAGFSVIDADIEAHRLYNTHAELRKAIAQTFGAQALTDQGVNRAYLATRVFSDAQELIKLEQLVHPLLFAHIEFCIVQYMQGVTKMPPVVFLDAALLYKWPEFVQRMAQVWVVETSQEIRVQRLIQRGLTSTDALNRIKSQSGARTLHGDHVIHINNNGSIHDCEQKVTDLLSCLID